MVRDDAGTARRARQFRRGAEPERGIVRDSMLDRERQRVTPGPITRLSRMRKTLAMVGSVAVSSLLGWLGSQYGLMTGFLLGMVGTGLGMYAGYRLAAHLGA